MIYESLEQIIEDHVVRMDDLMRQLKATIDQDMWEAQMAAYRGLRDHIELFKWRASRTIEAMKKDKVA